MLENVGNAITRLPCTYMDETWMFLISTPPKTRTFTSHHVSDMSAMMRLPWQRPLPSNGALNIQQLWASGGRTREPILTKFGTQQKITTTMTVT